MDLTDAPEHAELRSECRGWLREPGGRVVTNKFPANFRHLPLILDLLGIDAGSHVVMVGDREEDVKAAYAAGVTFYPRDVWFAQEY